MLTKLLTLILTLTFLLANTCGDCQSLKSDFSHIEIIIDSTDFEKLISNSFIRDSLGRTTYDTMQYNPLVISYYINGEESFIHFNPNKGYFATQQGTVYLIFQSRQPGQGKLLEQSLKSVTKDSLLSYVYKGSDFSLSEIIFKSHERLHKSNNNHFIPMLSSYSVETYKKWGLGDSTEVSMEKFLAQNSSHNKNLFNKIDFIRISITKDELAKLSSMMKVAGYERKRNKFIKAGQPKIVFSVNNSLNEYKVKEIRLLLNEYKNTKSFNFGKTSLFIKENRARFLFN